MKTIRKLLSVFGVLAVFLSITACQIGGNSANLAKISISVNGIDNSRQATVDDYDYETLSYTLQATNVADSSIVKKWDFADLTELSKADIELEKGAWNFELKAYSDILLETLACTASLNNFEIIDGSNVLAFQLEYVSGIGEVYYKVIYPCDIYGVPESARLVPMEYLGTEKEEDTAIELEPAGSFIGDDEGNTYSYFRSTEVPTGEYAILFSITTINENSGNSLKTLDMEFYVTVIPGKTTSGEFTFKDVNREFSIFYPYEYAEQTEDFPSYFNKYEYVYIPEIESDDDTLEFDSWYYIDSDDSKVILKDNILNSDYSLNSDIELFVNWTELPDPEPTVWKVKFVDEDDTEYKTFDVNDGETVDFYEVEKERYSFVAWLLDGEEYDFDAPVTSDITLTASWMKNDIIYKSEHVVVSDDSEGLKVVITKAENEEDWLEDIRFIEKESGTYFVINPEMFNENGSATFIYPFVDGYKKYEFELTYNYPDPENEYGNLPMSETVYGKTYEGLGELDYSEWNNMVLSLTESDSERYIGLNKAPKSVISAMLSDYEDISDIQTTFVINSGKADWTDTSWVFEITDNLDDEGTFLDNLNESDDLKANFITDEYDWWIKSNSMNNLLSDRSTYFVEFRARFSMEQNCFGEFSLKDIVSAETVYNKVNRDSGVTIKLPEISTPVDFNIIATVGTTVIEDSAFITSDSNLTFSIPDTIGETSSIVWATGLVADGSEETYTISAERLALWEGLMTVSCRVVDTNNKVWVSSISFIVVK